MNPEWSIGIAEPRVKLTVKPRAIDMITEELCLIFTGSNRAMLTLMFEDKVRPFFHLCEKITLDRIEESKYASFLKKAALGQWNAELPDDVVSIILQLSKRHPYYVNALCSRLWRCAEAPACETAQSAWKDICEQEGGRIAKDIATLKPNQRAVLNALAITPTDRPYAKDFLARINLSNSSVQRVIRFLLDRDLIYVDEMKAYRLTDPCLEQYLVSLSF